MPNSPQVSPSASDVFRVRPSRRAFSETASSENSEGAPISRFDGDAPRIGASSSNRTTSVRSCRDLSSERPFVSRLLKADVAASSRLGRDPNRPDARRSFKAANLDAVDRAAARTRSERSKVSTRKGVTEVGCESSSWRSSSGAKLGVPLNASAFSPPRSGVSPSFASDESRAPIFGVTRIDRARRASSPPSGSASSGRVSSGT